MPTLNIFKINDDKINEIDNLSVEITAAEPRTFDTLDEKGDLQKVTLNIIKPATVTTLGDLKKDLSNKEITIAQAQANLDVCQNDYDNQIALIDSIQIEADKLPARKPATDESNVL